MLNRRNSLAACATVLLAITATACGGSDEGSSEATTEQRCEAAEGIKTAVETGDAADTPEAIVSSLDAMAEAIEDFDKIAPSELDAQSALVLDQTKKMVDAVADADGDPFSADLSFLDDAEDADQAQDDLDMWLDTNCGFTIG